MPKGVLLFIMIEDCTTVKRGYVRNTEIVLVVDNDPPPAGARGFFKTICDNSAWALRAAASSPDVSLVLYAAQ